MPDEHLRFRCSSCNQLLGVSSKKAGAVIACPRCSAELKVPSPEEAAALAEASRPVPTAGAEARMAKSTARQPARSADNPLPPFMEEIAAAIPDDLAALRPEDIRVKAEFADLVVTTDESKASPSLRASALAERGADNLPGDPSEVEAYLAEISPPAEPPPMVPPEPVPKLLTESRTVDQAAEPSKTAALSNINVETPSLLPASGELQGVSQVVLHPATVLAWSLLVLIAVPMAFVAGLLMGHFIWK
jgi:phage FluMu protein Com